ncbi:putative ABC transporter [Zopfia rhizophila CBS 207.26]|uniref:Putative ABC transporter n=1 Tax=Zopfia rhizophila CBS 207.26 TaxID=1314779 RepID=A0A6A6DPL3_9PEZI|nr:putative ABC transporter [Zopfia rhizophila CBS 207.26]
MSESHNRDRSPTSCSADKDIGLGLLHPIPEPASYSANRASSADYLPSVAQTAGDTSAPLSEHGAGHTEENAQLEREIGHLARQITRRSTAAHGETNLFIRSWTKGLLRLEDSDPNIGPNRKAGVAFQNLSVFGYGDAIDYQKSVGNLPLQLFGLTHKLLGYGKRRIDILRDFEGLVEAGEMLMVLGPPGSGCSTLLKAIACEMKGIHMGDKSYVNYRGISKEQMLTYFRGEAIYTAENDVHFPMLSVGDTLAFAARARIPRYIPGGVPASKYAHHLRDVMMATFAISHTVNTRVGNDYVRGVSGGERKRVSIVEAGLSGAPLHCWDNSTRGPDSANAIEFCKNLRIATDLWEATAVVAIYQAPQSAYDLFDKVTVLYEGRQIYFGKITEARKYFEDLGFHCPDRQTTPDFLTSMTSSSERVVKAEFEDSVPRTSDEFAQRWRMSNARIPLGGGHYEEFAKSRRAQQAKSQRLGSPYTLSYVQQVKLWDPSFALSQLGGNFMMALVLGRALLFFALLLNAFGSVLEILTLYEQRPIVEKHIRYAFYHPSCEGISSMLTDLPYKMVNAVIFNLTLYFMANLRRHPGPFFIFCLVTFTATLAMSSLFRTIASVSTTMAQAMVPAALLVFGLVIYTGSIIPTDYMPSRSRWINYINPLGYAFESLMVNEFHNRLFDCSSYTPSGLHYENVTAAQRVCAVVGSTPNFNVVSGDAFIISSFKYYHSRKWRNIGILFGFWAFFTATYLIAVEFVTAKKTKGEVLIFRRTKHLQRSMNPPSDLEANGTEKSVPANMSGNNTSVVIERQGSVFHWQDVCYDIKIKGETRRILDNVDGWVRPGTLTALMGVSGAGKTTLLDVLATRVTTGVITGDMLVDGQQRDASFQRKTGYVQQQDVHLGTSTIREALKFSALLRQPASTPRKEMLPYVDEVIKLLDMEEYADAVIGVPGEGLNVEQRKRLTIGIELAAKSQLLLFLDEPTSKKLTRSGQAILCTIHQPSAMLFQRFDRLLLLAKGGKTVYFGDIGNNSSVIIDYFERNGAPKCPRSANPSEWMLEVIGSAPGVISSIDWFQTWRESREYQEVQKELSHFREAGVDPQRTKSIENFASHREFAAPFWLQWWEVQKRVAQQYWRTPSYIYSKASLCILSTLFIGFSFFCAANTLQGLQNQMYAVFMLMTLFGQLNEQIMPQFVTQRVLYETRERPSKIYSWQEIPWNTLMAAIIYCCWYYPIGLYRNAEPTNAVAERGFFMFLFIWAFMVSVSTFTHLVIAGIDSVDTGGNLSNICFSLCITFCGVLVAKDSLPGFWIFMYRISPFTYLVSGILATAVAGTKVVCAENEYVHFSALSGQTCGEYMVSYIARAGGYLQNPDSTDQCSFCRLSTTDAYLDRVGVHYSERWRNFGLMWIYFLLNIAGALIVHWLVRVPKTRQVQKA